MRVQLRGYRRSVTVGWKSPAAVRGLTRGGFESIAVSTIGQLVALNPAQHAVTIASTVGTKKRIAILTEANNRKFFVTNYKDPAAVLAAAQRKRDEERKRKQDVKKSRESKREETKKAVEKKKEKEDKKAAETIKAPEEKKESQTSAVQSSAAPALKQPSEQEIKAIEEKKEKDKILTSRNS